MRGYEDMKAYMLAGHARDILRKATRLTGRPVYDRKDLIIQAQRNAILTLVRGYDTGNLSEEDMNKARELLK